jgi:hypothetical protein
MALIARLFNFQPGTDIKASEANAELNQLVNAVNSKAELGANNTFTGNNIFSGANTFTGNATFSGNINLSGTFSGNALNDLLDLVDPIGIPKLWMGTTAPPGYVLGVGSIGSAASGATQRANADTERLYKHFWNNLSDEEAPVAGGRGASAEADFAANKPLTMPDPRGKCFVVLDNLGGTAANNFPDGVPNKAKASILGGIFGAVMHILTEMQIPPHSHPYTRANRSESAGNGSSAWEVASLSTVNTGSTGGGQAHNNTQLSMAVGVIYRL